MRCPNSTESGCRCPEHHPGLLESSRPENRAALAAALDEVREVRISVVTTGPSSEPACDGTMTCSCPRCIEQRLALAAAKPEPVRQPWEPRPARQEIVSLDSRRPAAAPSRGIETRCMGYANACVCHACAQRAAGQSVRRTEAA